MTAISSSIRRVSSTLSLPQGMSLREAATRASNARKDELKKLASPLLWLGESLLNNSRKLLAYMEYNFGALSESELVEALGNHLEVLHPNILQADANLFIGYARLALHSATPHEALVYLLQELNKIEVEAVAAGKNGTTEALVIWRELLVRFEQPTH